MTAGWTLWALFKRDALLAFSYRMNALLTLFSALFGVALWYFLSGALSPATPGWAPAGYFPFVVTGMALHGYAHVALYTVGKKVREDQHSGTLELLMGAPAPPFLVLTASILWEMAAKTLEMAVFVSIAFAFGFRVHPGSLSALCLIIVLTVVDFMAIGMIAASLLLVFQRGEPVTPFVGALFALLGGVFFPIKVLPPLLQAASRLLPLTYALEGVRGVLFQSKGLAESAPSISALLLFALVLVPLSLAVFRLCLALARRCGLLGKY